MRSSFRIGAALVAILATGTACTPLDDAMVMIFGRSMRDQDSFDPYENPLMPPENAVPFAAGNLPAGPGQVNIGQPEAPDYDIPDFTQAATLSPANPVLAGLANPVPADPASLARGQVLYDRYCAVCHGPEGIGTGAQILERWPALAAYNLAMDPVRGYPDGYIYGMIRVGRGMMPQYGHQIPHFDRWHIVNYVRQLQADNDAGQGQQPAGGGEG